MKTLYTAEATAYGKRTGTVVSSDERLDLQLSRPASMGGDDGPGTNPEQLFAAGYAACFHSAMRYALKDLGLSPDSLDGAHVTARVSLLKEEPSDLALAVELDAHLPNMEREQAQAVVEKTHTVCPYSRSIVGNVEVRLQVV